MTAMERSVRLEDGTWIVASAANTSSLWKLTSASLLSRTSSAITLPDAKAIGEPLLSGLMEPPLSNTVAFLISFAVFSIGVAGFPEGHIAQTEGKYADWQHLKHKIDQGADFVITQLFFNNRDYFEFRDYLTSLGVGVPLHRSAELDLQPARQVEVVLGLHDVGDAALAGLAVHPDDGLVAAADVLGVDGQVRHGPHQLAQRKERLAVERRLGIGPARGLVDRVEVGLGLRLHGLRQVVQHIGRLVHPTALLLDAGPDLPRGLPEAERAVAADPVAPATRPTRARSPSQGSRRRSPSGPPSCPSRW